MSAWAAIGRASLRTAVYPAIPARWLAHYVLAGARRSLRSRAAWLQRVARSHAVWINLQVRVHGAVPNRGLVVSNHVSYLDIVALSAAGGFAFVSKEEVAGWPLFGTYARWGGTIFVDRERRAAVSDVADEMGRHLDAGIPLVLFPEGTSSDGSQVFPFRSSLLEPVVQLGCPVTPCGIRYFLPGGDVAQEVAYWGDMTLGPHLLNLMSKRGVIVELTFGQTEVPASDRKRLARSLRDQVEQLAGVGQPLVAA